MGKIKNWLVSAGDWARDRAREVTTKFAGVLTLASAAVYQYAPIKPQLAYLGVGIAFLLAIFNEGKAQDKSDD